MKENYTYASLDYIGKHKIYCFKRSFSSINPLKRVVYKYEEGDYLPLINNNYTYGPDILIVDLRNQLVHIVEDSIYKKTVRILKDIDVSIYPYFKKKRYHAIDIYGNVLNIFNIFDLYRCVNSYPNVEIYLEEKRKYRTKDISYSDIKNDCITVVDNINQYKDNGLLLSGYITNDDKNGCDEGVSFEVAGQISKEILEPLVESFEDEFFDEYDTYAISNRMLEMFDLLYSLESNNNGKIIKYISNGKLKVTHIDKLRREIKLIIDDNCECELGDIIDLIFSSIDDDIYVEFIIDEISKVLDIND